MFNLKKILKRLVKKKNGEELTNCRGTFGVLNFILKKDRINNLGIIGELKLVHKLKNQLKKNKNIQDIFILSLGGGDALEGTNEIEYIFDFDCSKLDGIVIVGTNYNQFRVIKDLIEQFTEGLKIYKYEVGTDKILVNDESSIFLKSLYKRPEFCLKTKNRKVIVNFFPVLSNEKKFYEEYYKLLWYLPYQKGVKVFIPVSKKLKKTLANVKKFEKPKMLGKWSSVYKHIEIISYKEEEFKTEVVKSDIVLAWDTSSLSKEDYRTLNELENIFIIDKHHNKRRAGFNYNYLDFYIQSKKDIECLRIRSKKNLMNALEEVKDKKKSYIFGSGPSLKKAFEFDFSDGIGIVCNTLVKNTDLLDHIKPAFIVAADADYHFGCALYDSKFREDLLKAIKRTGAKLVCPEFFVPLMLHHYPGIVDDIVGVPVFNAPLNVNLKKRFWLSAKDNVFNLLLMPLASTVSSEIYIMGFDGKKPGDDKFWNYDPNSQYSDLMKSIEFCNPAFYEYVDYNEAFEKHCDLVEEITNYCESEGKKVYSLTASVIPAISQRYIK